MGEVIEGQFRVVDDDAFPVPEFHSYQPPKLPRKPIHWRWLFGETLAFLAFISTFIVVGIASDKAQDFLDPIFAAVFQVPR